MKLLKILITILTCLSVSILHAQVIPNQGQWEPVGNTILFKQFSDADNTDGVMDGAGLVSSSFGAIPCYFIRKGRCLPGSLFSSVLHFVTHCFLRSPLPGSLANPVYLRSQNLRPAFLWSAGRLYRTP